MYRVDREQSLGGGVILYVRESLRSALVVELTNHAFCDTVWCNIHLDEVTLLVGVCYRSTSSSAGNGMKLLDLVETAVAKADSGQMLLMGDFNYPRLHRLGMLESMDCNTEDIVFHHKMQDLFLVQNIHQATRQRGQQTPSHLDLVYTLEDNLVQNVAYESPLGKSDHVVLVFDLALEDVTCAEQGKKRNYWKGNFVNIAQELAEIDWDVELRTANIQEAWVVLKSILEKCVAKYVPWREQGRKPKKNRWMTRRTLRWIKRRSEAWSKYRKSRTVGNYNGYKKIRNMVTEHIKNDKQRFQTNLISKFRHRPKQFYSYIRNKQTVKDRVFNLQKQDGTITVGAKEAADELCKTFEEVFTDENLNFAGIPPSEMDADINIKFTPDIVYNKLCRLKTDKAQGPDGIHPAVLKNCAEQLAKPVSMIFTMSFEQGVIPLDWKLANITPIYKKGLKSDAGNYRPVSLTSVLCKVMESVIKEEVVKVLDEQQRLTKHQHGFIKGKSCLTNLLETLEAWTRLIEEGYGVDVIFLDYKKAFDTVPHRRLLEKLKNYGFRGKLGKWTESFLLDRLMRVAVQGECSSWVKVRSGVPQGSGLGPLLFLLFVNDLPDRIKNSIKMFADDTKVWTAIKEAADSEGLQQDLDKLREWTNEWQLQLNLEKCKVMHIAHSCKTEYDMGPENDRVTLQETDGERDLGVFITKDLKPAVQCEKAAAKAMSMLGMINRHFRNLDAAGFLIIYKTYVRPHLEYAVQAWSPFLIKDIQCLERVQRRATKLVTAIRNKPYEERLKLLGLTTLEDRRRRGDLLQVYRIMTDKSSLDKTEFFTQRDTGHQTRGHELKLYSEGCVKAARRGFYSQRVVSYWNKLPGDVVGAETVNMFKNRYDRWMNDADI